jgi:DNA-binding MarR family transcriptional regulator
MENKHRIVTDIEADASIESLKTGDVVPAREFFGGYDIDKAKTCPAENGSNSNQLAPAELKLLRAIVEHPMRRSSEYAKLAGISPNTLLKIRPVFVEKGLIRENKLETSNRGRAAILLEPLEPAKQLVVNCEE